MEDVNIKDIIQYMTLLIGVGSVYWKLVIRIVKLEGSKDDLNKKVDILIKSVEILTVKIGEHIAYHRGKEETK